MHMRRAPAVATRLVSSTVSLSVAPERPTGMGGFEVPGLRTLKPPIPVAHPGRPGQTHSAAAALPVAVLLLDRVHQCVWISGLGHFAGFFIVAAVPYRQVAPRLIQDLPKLRDLLFGQQ